MSEKKKVLYESADAHLTLALATLEGVPGIKLNVIANIEKARKCIAIALKGHRR